MSLHTVSHDVEAICFDISLSTSEMCAGVFAMCGILRRMNCFFVVDAVACQSYGGFVHVRNTKPIALRCACHTVNTHREKVEWFGLHETFVGETKESHTIMWTHFSRLWRNRKFASRAKGARLDAS